MAIVACAGGCGSWVDLDWDCEAYTTFYYDGDFDSNLPRCADCRYYDTKADAASAAEEEGF